MRLLVVLLGFSIVMGVAFALKIAHLEWHGRWSDRRGFPVDRQDGGRRGT